MHVWSLLKSALGTEKRALSLVWRGSSSVDPLEVSASRHHWWWRWWWWWGGKQWETVGFWLTITMCCGERWLPVAWLRGLCISYPSLETGGLDVGSDTDGPRKHKHTHTHRNWFPELTTNHRGYSHISDLNAAEFGSENSSDFRSADTTLLPAKPASYKF